MANSIELAKKFVPIIDGVYKAESVTNGMDAAAILLYGRKSFCSDC